MSVILPAIETFRSRFSSIRFFLAPMAGITDTVFRTLMREMGAQCVISELVSSEGLVRGGENTRELTHFCEKERPFGIQIFGSSVRSMVEAAKVVEGVGADFVDINFGCPVKKVVCDGGGAAWLKDPLQLGKLLSEIRSGITIPLTIKIRTGWDESSKNVAEVVSIAATSGVEWVAIHGRTRAQGYSGASDWELIRSVSKKSRLPIIGNGDLITAEGALTKINEGYCHAVMIGRGALKNPWIFMEILGVPFFQRDFLHFIRRHFELAIEVKNPLRAFLSLKKFISWYATGLPHCSEFRRQLFVTSEIGSLQNLAYDFFQRVDYSQRQDDGRPFLMGGHG